MRHDPEFFVATRPAARKIDGLSLTGGLVNLQTYLDEMGISYRISHHRTAYTAQDLAAAEHVPGRQVIKPVVVRADGQFVMCALPASHRIDLAELRHQLQAEEVELADESKLGELFPECELGAEPPVGKLFGMPTLMDESLVADSRVTFQAGTHSDAVTMSLADYRRVAQPEMAYFGRHL
jgi:Ala-tRNA(Pro) deacylase